MTAGQRASYAFCPGPDCGKRLRVPPPTGDAPRFPGHRHSAGGTCPTSHAPVRAKDREHDCADCRDLPVPWPGAYDHPGHRVGVHSRPPAPRPIKGKVGHRLLCASHLQARLAAQPVVHPCIRCRELPELPAGIELPAGADPVRHGYRPAEPRPIKGKRMCDYHLRIHNELLRVKRSSARRLKTHGVTDELSAQARAAQGGGCACGRPFRAKYTPRTDHDHRVAREQCGHDPAHACPNCYRGDLHDACNVAIGRFTVDQLRRLADYKAAGGTMAVLRAQGRVTIP